MSGGLRSIATALNWVCAVLLLFSQPVLAAAVRDIGLTLKATPNPVAVNSTLTYLLEVKNLGNQTVKGPLFYRIAFLTESCIVHRQKSRSWSDWLSKTTRVLVV